MTFNRVSKSIAAFSSLCALSLLTCATTVQAKPAPRPTVSYERAQRELPKNMYVLYRIIDRLARSNNLSERPWRVAVVPKYSINAFATDVNLVAIYTGLLDQLAGDSSALACVVAHEMGHNVKKHIAVGEAQKAALIEQAKKEAEAEVNQEINTANTTSTTTSIAGGLLSIFGGRGGAIGGAVIEGAGRQRASQAQQRVQEIVQKKKQDLEARIAESDRRQEFEADEAGYLYAARAGFEPEGCLRAMAVLARTPGAEFDTSHPAVPKRVEAIKQLMVKYPPTSLAAEGKAKIAATRPLTYDLSEDRVSLRVNSTFGGSTQSDIDRLFGK